MATKAASTPSRNGEQNTKRPGALCRSASSASKHKVGRAALRGRMQPPRAGGPARPITEDEFLAGRHQVRRTAPMSGRLRARRASGSNASRCYAAPSRTACSASPPRRATVSSLKIGVSPICRRTPRSPSLGRHGRDHHQGSKPRPVPAGRRGHGRRAGRRGPCVYCHPRRRELPRARIGEVVSKTGDGGGTVTVARLVRRTPTRSPLRFTAQGRAQHRRLRLLHRRATTFTDEITVPVNGEL